MSEIDKLINQAFPDELRDVEPIDVDEDAILSMTLESLGLKPSLKAELPELPVKPGRRRRSGDKKSEPEFVEVPVVVRRRWMDWAGWAIAACLVLVVAVNWGPWLINNLGFGLRPRSQGDVEFTEDERGGVYSTDNGFGATVYTVSVKYRYSEDTMELTLYLNPAVESETLDMDEFAFEMREGYNGEPLNRKSLVSQGNMVTLEYELGGVRRLILTVRRARALRDADGREVGFTYIDVDKLELDLNSGHAESMLKNGKFDFEAYGTVAEPAPDGPGE